MADSKLTALTATTTPATTDIVYIVTTPGGTPASKQVTVANLRGTLASASYKRTAGDYTTTSSTFADVDGTNMSLTITTGAHRVLIGFVGTVEINATNDNILLDVTVDGTRQGGTLGLISPKPGTSLRRVNGSFTFLTDVLTAASHTFKLQWANISNTNTATIHGTSADSVCQFYVIEQGG